MDKEIDIAVNWWAEQLGTRHQDAGDAHLNGMMQVFHCAEPPTDEQKENFKIALKNQFNDADKEHGFGLRVDYDPDVYLRNAAEEIGYKVTNGSFPVKTTMFVENGKVEISNGYGSPYMPIYITADRGTAEIARLRQQIEAIELAMTK